MKILIISTDASICDLAWRLEEEGNEVKVYIHKKDYRKTYDGILKNKIADWKVELRWVGKKGLIIFDHTGMGELQDRLRKRGFNVVGSCRVGDLLEDNRKFGQRVFSQVGMEIEASRTFYDLDEAIDFIKRNPSAWVIKQNGHLDKDLNYVGRLDDGADTIAVLELYRKIIPKSLANFDLQKRIRGIEIGVGRYFNGRHWVGPIEFNIEHKCLFPWGLGPKTFEMGTIMWYGDNEKNKLYQGTIARMEKFLQKIGFIGDFEINCIVNENHIFPLEATARFGYPAIQLQTQFHQSPWGEFLLALARGENYDLKWKKGIGMVMLLAAPPFPYRAKDPRQSSKGIQILIEEKTFKDKKKNIHLEEVYQSKKDGKIYVSSEQGYVMHISSVRDTLFEARQEILDIVKDITIPKMFYRNDIGAKFLQEEKPLLKKWGYLK
jgi:phosphoribosylamine---glycine ligase